MLKGRDTLFLSPADLTPLHLQVNETSDAIGAGRNTNPLFLYGFNEVRLVIDTVVGWVQALIAQPSGGRPVPQIGWLGVVAVATWLAAAFGGLRVGGADRRRPGRCSGCRGCGPRAWTPSRSRSRPWRCAWRSASRWGCGRA